MLCRIVHDNHVLDMSNQDRAPFQAKAIMVFGFSVKRKGVANPYCFPGMSRVREIYGIENIRLKS